MLHHESHMTTNTEEPITRSSEGDRAYRLCRCAECGEVSRCTPTNDFYDNRPGHPNDMLFCLTCTVRPPSRSSA